MGADSFIAFYGIKFPLDPEDEETLDACGDDTDPRCVDAINAGLETFSGNMTDSEDYFVYIGARLGWLGLENDSYIDFSRDQLIDVMDTVQAKLKVAGFDQKPLLHLQFMAQY